MKVQCKKCGRDFGERNAIQGAQALVLRCCDTTQIIGRDARVYRLSPSAVAVVVACAGCGATVVEHEMAPTLLIDPPDCAACGVPDVAPDTEPAPSLPEAKPSPPPKARSFTEPKKKSKR